MTESLLNFTLANTSPMINYGPGLDYEPLGPGGLGVSDIWWLITGEGDDLVYRTTKAGSWLQLDFDGTAIYVYGDMSMPFQVDFDGTFHNGSSIPPGNGAPPGLIWFDEFLSPGGHSLNMTVMETDDPNAEFMFNYTIIANSYPITQVPVPVSFPANDITSSGEWSKSPNGTAATSTTNASLTLPFNGVAVSMTGPLRGEFISYAVSLDAAEPINLNPMGVTSQDVTLFYQSGLDPTQEHTIVVTNTGREEVAIDSITVWQVGASSSSVGVPSAAPTSASSATSANGGHSNIAKIVAPIVAVVGAIILALAVWACTRRRQRRRNFMLSGPFGLRFSRAFRTAQSPAMMSLTTLESKTDQATNATAIPDATAEPQVPVPADVKGAAVVGWNTPSPVYRKEAV
ncbi:hypothetical protein CERSUDRAFT_116789 [Gelatoporia subvermispora B]|uniref:Uncharacterized protein n=1 Tax=Ceriporiopsis subvermispora (strain B) TaxID=914234 RepID=M2QR13_CERS8|nr:hypothetical protein CERSUDRAFT_116789 [Gelatoporia subvermispora B]